MVVLTLWRAPFGDIFATRKHSTFHIAFSEYALLVRQLWSKRIREPIWVILYFSYGIVMSLLIAFSYFQLPDTTDSVSARYKVLTLNTFLFTAISILTGSSAFHGYRETNSKGNSGFALVDDYGGALALWWARFSADLPWKILLNLLSGAIIYPIVGLRSGFQYYLVYQLALIMQAFGNTGFALCNAAFFRNQHVNNAPPDLLVGFVWRLGPSILQLSLQWHCISG